MPIPRLSHLAPSRWVLAATLLVASACGEATDPNALLVGEWGSETTLLVALRSGAEVRLGCAVLIIDDPIELRASGTFAIQGRLQPSTATFGPLPQVRGSGQVSGSRVTLVLPLGEADGSVTYQLEAGVRPAASPLDGPVCPL